jgi:isopentenyl-diphosphate delta-isomerase
LFWKRRVAGSGSPSSFLEAILSISTESPDESSDKSFENFANRKADHIRLALDSSTQATGQSGLSSILLIHEALPEINFSDVSLEVNLFGHRSASPLFISSMTAGHAGSFDINLVMARVAQDRGWAMGVGSQRRQLADLSADREWIEIRKQCPQVRFFGNIGLSQLIQTSISDVRRLADTLNAEAMIVHTNPLQECLQPEGTPQFAGGLNAISELVKKLGLPVIVKETGCGFSKKTLDQLKNLGIAAVDVAGLGGTHWGRVEGGRSNPGDLLHESAQTFASWGVSTVESVMSAVALSPDYSVWASGGVRTGLDAAKLIAIGANMVGVAMPVIEAALRGEVALDNRLKQLEYEMKIALFCTGSKNVREVQEKKVWAAVKT